MKSKFEGVKNIIIDLAKKYKNDRKKILGAYDTLSEKYPTLPRSTFICFVNEILNELKIKTPKEVLAEVDTHHIRGTYKNLAGRVKEIAEKFNYNKTNLYELYTEIVKEYPTLKYSYYSRLVREICSAKGIDSSKRVNFEKSVNNNCSLLEKEELKDRYDELMKEIQEHKEKEEELAIKKFNSEYEDIELVDSYKDNSFKRMIILSDLHCGHMMGLTPPSWQIPLDNELRINIAHLQREAWNWYISTISRIGNKCDALVINGDAIDGDGRKSGGTELITTDRLIQAEIASECISVWNTDNIFMTRGTPYHVGYGENFEDVVAEKVGAYIEDVLNLNFNGKNFNFVHKSDGSSVPYARATHVVKTAIINEIVANYHNSEKADVVVRSHLHYYVEYKDSQRVALITPALQVDSKYGKQQCQGVVDFGFVVVDVYDGGAIIVTPHIAKFESRKSFFIKI